MLLICGSETDIYTSSGFLPGSPTMIAATLHDNSEVVDLTISNGIYVIPLA